MADTKRGRERKGREKQRQLVRRLYDHEVASTLPDADVDVDLEPESDPEVDGDGLLVAGERDED
jgi:hypothetical protein